MREFITRDEIGMAIDPPLVESRTFKPVFIVNQKPDRMAAAHRLAIVEETMDNMFLRINAENMNNREMPEDLRKKYNDVYALLLAIRNFEERIVVER